MRTYYLTKPIGAVLLKDPPTATTIPPQSKIKVIGPSKHIDGYIDVECDDHRYAVFQRDLDESGETTKSAAE